MEYVEGIDLRELLRRAARQRIAVPVEFSLLVVAEALRALSYAHRMGVIHRDVSPSNVLVSFEGEVKLCDFGIARAADLAALPADEALQGKFGYMSPEHARGEPIDERADVFAAGILLWELCAGRRLYRADEDVNLLDLARRAEIPPLPERRLPDEGTLHAIAMRALEPRRDDRYPSAAAMLRDLDRYAASTHLAASPLRFGAWVREHFAEEVVAARRARERAMRALDLGPPAVIVPIAPLIPDRALPAADPAAAADPVSAADPAAAADPVSAADPVAEPDPAATAGADEGAESPSPGAAGSPAPAPAGIGGLFLRAVAACAVGIAIGAPAFWYLATR
jgi:serine/threonine-protein kinase